jgi:hypothetical protein
MSHRRRALCFLLLILFAFSIRLTYVLIKRAYLEPGAAEMERAAANLARTGVLGNVYSSDSGPSAHVSPLYPLMLSLIYRLFGSDNWMGRLAQELFGVTLSSLTITLVPVIAQRARLAAGAGWFAALVLSVLPINLWVETSGAWEQPAAALLLLLTMWTFLALHDHQWQAPGLVLLLGTWTGLAALLSPALMPGVALMVFAEFVWSARTRKAMLRTMPLLLMPILLCVGPWMLRNQRVLGGAVAMRSNLGLELWIGNHPGSTGRTFDGAWDDTNNFIYQAHPYLNRQELLVVKEVGELEFMKRKQRQALEWIGAHPSEFLSLCMERGRLFWFPPPDLWTNPSSVRLLKAVFYNAFAICMFAELFVLVVSRQSTRFLWLGALLGPSLIYLLTHVDARYRYPVFALSALLGCSFGLRAVHWLRLEAIPWLRLRLISTHVRRGAKVT